MSAPPRRPQERLPALEPGAARRLVRIDVRRFPQQDGRLVVDARAHDETGAAREVADASELRVDVAADGTVASLDARPDRGTGALVGTRVVGGLRKAARELLREPVDAGPSPLAALLDDVPVAVLVSGYLDVRAGRLGSGVGGVLRDVCAGWGADGEPFGEIQRTGSVPTSELTPVADARLGEPFPPLAPGSLRRVRWIDVEGGPGGSALRAGFRDSCREGDGPEGVLHEYALTAAVTADGQLDHVRAEPRVLPFAECLHAVGPAGEVDGPPTTLPVRTPRLLAGTRGCTHLSDLIRTLACLPRLLRLLHADGSLAAPAPAR